MQDHLGVGVGAGPAVPAELAVGRGAPRVRAYEQDVLGVVSVRVGGQRGLGHAVRLERGVLDRADSRLVGVDHEAAGREQHEAQAECGPLRGLLRARARPAGGCLLLGPGTLRPAVRVDLVEVEIVVDVSGTSGAGLRRSGLGAYLLLLIRTDPPAMQQKLTALLSEQKRLFLDPFTESAFVHTTIPLSCFPASPDPGSVATLAASSAKWLEKRTALIAEARVNAAAVGGNPDARALLVQYQSQSNNVMGARMQAAGNIGAANAAYAMAMAERQRALLNRAMETQDIYSDYTYKWQQAPGGNPGIW